MPAVSFHGLPLHKADPATAHFENHIKELHEIAQWKKPSGMKVIGLVFYGRRRFVSILDCYLKVRDPGAFPHPLSVTWMFFLTSIHRET